MPSAEFRRRYFGHRGGELAALSPPDRLEHLLVHGLIGIAAPAMAEGLLAFSRQWQPDLVIGNLAAWASEVAATALGVPHVIHGFSSPKAEEMGAAARAALAEVYEGCGVDPPPDGAHRVSPYLDIWPEGLRPQAQQWLYPNMWSLRPEHVLPPVARSSPAPSLAGLPFERTVYVTAGTTYNSTPGLLEAMVDALREGSRRSFSAASDKEAE